MKIESCDAAIVTGADDNAHERRSQLFTVKNRQASELTIAPQKEKSVNCRIAESRRAVL